MLSYAKVKNAIGGIGVAYITTPLVLNQAELDEVDLVNYNYVTQGISSDIGFDYVMSDGVELNFD